jgi:hypothetical protein
MAIGIVTDVNSRSSSDHTYAVHLAKQIFDFADVEEARHWIKKGGKKKGFCTYLPCGEACDRWKGIRQGNASLDYRIEIKTQQQVGRKGPKQSEVKTVAVHVFKRLHNHSLLKVTVPSAFFTDEGFDVETYCRERVGLILSSALSAYLYALVLKVHTPVVVDQHDTEPAMA